MSKIVVFGGDGFIGKHLVTTLAKDKQDQIVVFDRFTSYKNDSKQPFEDLTNVSIVPGDFFNRNEVGSVLDNVDYVFHLVSSTNPAVSNNDPFIDIDTNIRSSVELFQLCVEHKVKKVLFASSGGTVYGDIDGTSIPETTSPQPKSPYGIGKLTIENYLRYFKSTHELDYTVYRIANPYGPGQNIYGKQGVIPIFLHRYITKEPLSIYGDGEMLRDYVYIDDLTSMITGSFKKQGNYDTYNIGSGLGVSVNQLVDAIEACTKYSIEKQHFETPETYIRNSVLDISRFISDFALEPTVDLEEGIRRTWEYVKSIE